MFSPVDPKKPFPAVEKEILDFWEKEGIFKKSVLQNKHKKKFVFFDGPPFANGLPHYGHILASALKDAVTRYWNMQGYYVPRANGWDCHGLPVEYEIEKELKLSGRKDIEKMGVEKFNDACRESVFRYTKEWEKLLKRVGRWVDFDDTYATLDNDYMESIWWVFSEIWKKGLVYQGHKPMHICPRCETSLSNFEVTLGYKEVADMSVTVKFELVDEPKTFFLAWTTTPWSLLSVTGLAIGPNFDYAKVRTEDGTQYYVAKNLVEKVFNGLGEYTIVSTHKGSELSHKAFKHVFDFYKKDPKVLASPNAYKTIPTDYVSVEDGTGIVTINGAFGDIDFEAAQKNNLPIFVNVGTDGVFLPEVGEFAGMFVKEAEPAIAESLKKRGLLLRKDPIRHSYPHCWRCDTPLLSYATKSWFIRVTELKQKLLKNNKKIHWTPEHIQEGRFGKWLEGARDWNISRNRFWGCPIPIWQCECGNQTCIGSLKELSEKATTHNTFFLVRHGESEANVRSIMNSDPKKEFHLTEEGRAQALKTAQELKRRGVDAIFASPLLRTQETAEIISRETGIPIITDDRLREHEMGEFEGTNLDAYLKAYPDPHERYKLLHKNGESFAEMEPRVLECMNELNSKYAGKNIVVVSHGDPIRAAARYFDRLDVPATFEFKPGNASICEFIVGGLPLRGVALDLHKPYIDKINLKCDACGKKMTRITEVLDCWFESGAMPYAQLHYPFENKKEFEQNFPANFIAEGLDQTRGWFYTLHVISTILFNTPAFNNIIVNGIMLAADGEKLSKRKKNYPDPNVLFETHGVDTTRMFLYTSTAPLAEDVRFSEKHVEELVKKFTLTLWNTYSFFVTYATIDKWSPPKNTVDEPYKNKLDEWIISELNVLIEEMTQQMDEYNLTRATRPIMAFMDNLSNWYVRRSRRRFWKSENDGDKESAYRALHTVLVTVCKLLAPFMPFVSDSIFKNLTGKESVHLESWPTASKKDISTELNTEIHTVRDIVSLALRLRSRKNIKVRQPLSKLVVALPKNIASSMVESYRDVILEELNVKNMTFAKGGTIAVPLIVPDPRKLGPRFGKETQDIINLCKAGNCVVLDDGTVHIPGSGEPKYILQPAEFQLGYKGKEGHEVESEGGLLVSLNTTVTDELRDEGYARDIVRFVQELRKKADYAISDKIYVYVQGPKAVLAAVTQYSELVRKETLALEIQEGGDFDWDKEAEVEIDTYKVKIGVRRAHS